jgi:hypothetical protein
MFSLCIASLSAISASGSGASNLEMVSQFKGVEERVGVGFLSTGVAVGEGIFGSDAGGGGTKPVGIRCSIFLLARFGNSFFIT